MAETGTGTEAAAGVESDVVTPEPTGWAADLGVKLDGDAAKIAGKYESLEALATAAANSASLIGQSVQLPKDGATDTERAEAMGKVYSKLGKPDTAAGYEFEAPADLPEGLVWSPEIATAYSEHCLKNNLTVAQAQAEMTFYHEIRTQEIAQVQAAQTQAATDATEALRKEVGPDRLDGYISEAQQAYDKFGGPELIALFDKFGLKNNAVIVKAFHGIYDVAMREGKAIDGAPATSKSPGTFSDAFYKTPQTTAEM